MFLTILIVFISLLTLITLHELGHFFLAKKFGVKVEEFGIGLPPRIFGKKFGETIFSLNLLPLGAFVRLYGEEKEAQGPRSFAEKPVWQRALIIVGGVVVFWIVAFIILTIIAGIWGIPTAVSDQDNNNLINPQVQIIAVAPESPAEKAGLQIGDNIINLKSPGSDLTTNRTGQVQAFVDINKGREVVLKIQRGGKVFDATLVPRVSPPENEGAMGVGLARIGYRVFPWYQAPIQGALITAKTTVLIPYFLGSTLGKKIQGEPTPKVEFRGPIGIGQLMGQALGAGVNNFLYFLAVISIYLALFNMLPIPVVDGGKLLLLGIEKVRGRAVNHKLEEKVSALFFALLIALMIWITIKDVIRLF